MYSSLRVLLDDVQPLHFHPPNRPWQTRPVNFLRAKHAAHSSSVVFSFRHLFLHQHIQLVVTWVFSTESGMTVLWHGLPGGLPTSLLAGRFPVDVSADQKAAFPRTQTLSAPEPAHFPRSDTKLPCLSTHNIHRDSSPDTAGDNPPHRRNGCGNRGSTAARESVRSTSGRRCNKASDEFTAIAPVSSWRKMSARVVDSLAQMRRRRRIAQRVRLRI
jgi:hypothetical protein